MSYLKLSCSPSLIMSPIPPDNGYSLFHKYKYAMRVIQRGVGTQSYGNGLYPVPQNPGQFFRPLHYADLPWTSSLMSASEQESIRKFGGSHYGLRLRVRVACTPVQITSIPALVLLKVLFPLMVSRKTSSMVICLQALTDI